MEWATKKLWAREQTSNTYQREHDDSGCAECNTAPEMFVHAASSQCHYSAGESLNATEKP
jgi:hypothetical protein